MPLVGTPIVWIPCAVAIVTTYGEQSFDDKGNYKDGNASQPIFGAIAAYLAPNDPPGASMLK